MTRLINKHVGEPCFVLLRTKWSFDNEYEDVRIWMTPNWTQSYLYRRAYQMIYKMLQENMATPSEIEELRFCDLKPI